MIWNKLTIPKLDFCIPNKKSKKHKNLFKTTANLVGGAKIHFRFLLNRKREERRVITFFSANWANSDDLKTLTIPKLDFRILDRKSKKHKSMFETTANLVGGAKIHFRFLLNKKSEEKEFSTELVWRKWPTKSGWQLLRLPLWNREDVRLALRLCTKW